MLKRIVITGMGAVTPLGTGVEEYWKNLSSGACGLGEIAKLDTSNLPIHRAGEVRDFHPGDFMPKALALDTEPFARYAYAAAIEAVAQSGLDTRAGAAGVVMGTALHGIDYIARVQREFDESGKPAEPKLLTKYMGNIAASQFAIHFGMHGPSMTVSTACSTGGDAVNLASMLLETGRAEAVVVMAGEAAISPAVIQSLSKIKAMSPTGESRPFCADRNGFVIGEGGGALVLETEEHALKRGAAVLARLLGCANNTDGYHPVSPHPEGRGAAECIRLALKSAGISPEQVGYVNAHGTATIKGDAAEAAAISSVFGEHSVPVSSTKGATGHMMAAGGVTEVIACVKAVQTGVLPPNLGLTERGQDEGFALDLVTAESQRRPAGAAISNAMGFGGQNSCVVVGRYQH